MVGELARQDDYGYSDLGIPIAPQVAPPAVTDLGQADLTPFAMGALAQQRYYQPTDATGADLWGHQTAAGMISPQDIDKATGMALSFSGGGLATKGIKAYHGSPHDFERFDLSKIGTGEGAQAYGHGLYFADNPTVAEQYKASLAKPTYTYEGTDYGGIKSTMFDDRAKILHEMQTIGKDAALRNIEDNIRFNSNYAPTIADLQRAHLDWAKGVDPAKVEIKNPGRMYEVNINADPAQMLDWDKPLYHQPRKAMNVLFPEFNPSEYDLSDLHNVLRTEAAIKDLREAGIPGIKYLDAGSRGPVARIQTLEERIAREQAQGLPYDHWQTELDQLKAQPPSSNYVVFDPSIIDIMRKYGIAGAAPAGMGALAAQDQYRNP